MPWPVLAATALGVGASLYGASKTAKAAERAAERESAASAEALQAQQEAYQESRMMLQPYAAQEQAASTQLMAQMGLAPPSTGGGGGGDFFGAPGGPSSQNMNQFIEDLLTEQMVIAKRSGYDKQKGLNEGARRTVHFIDQLKSQGKLPANFQAPSMTDLVQQAGRIEDTYGGLTKMEKTLSPGVTLEGYGTQNIQGMLDKYGVGDAAGKPGAPTAGEDIGEGIGEGPTPQTAADIMGRAGVEGLPEGLGEQYYAGIMEDPRTDPELAGYLGLTPESMQVGAEYQQTPAYMAAREAGISAVDAGAAGAGQLYSGRRGEALRDVGQQVEQQYYTDAMNRRGEMLGARRAERGAGLARMGGAYETGRQREQSYYNNYMQLLNQLAAPTTTTNIASMGTSLGKETSANIMGTARNIGDLQIGGAGATQAAYGDVAGGLMRLGAAYI